MMLMESAWVCPPAPRRFGVKAKKSGPEWLEAREVKLEAYARIDSKRQAYVRWTASMWNPKDYGWCAVTYRIERMNDGVWRVSEYETRFDGEPQARRSMTKNIESRLRNGYEIVGTRW